MTERQQARQKTTVAEYPHDAVFLLYQLWTLLCRMDERLLDSVGGKWEDYGVQGNEDLVFAV